MNFASTPRRALAPGQPIAAPLNHAHIPAARLANSLPFASKPLSTASESGDGRYPSFSYSCKCLHPQLLSFDTHTNSPGGGYPLSISSPPVRARYIVPSSPGDQLNLPKIVPLGSIATHTRSLFRSLAKERNTSPLFSSSCALLPKNTRVYPRAFSGTASTHPTLSPTLFVRSNVVLSERSS